MSFEKIADPSQNEFDSEFEVIIGEEDLKYELKGYKKKFETLTEKYDRDIKAAESEISNLTNQLFQVQQEYLNSQSESHDLKIEINKLQAQHDQLSSEKIFGSDSSLIQALKNQSPANKVQITDLAIMDQIQNIDNLNRCKENMEIENIRLKAYYHKWKTQDDIIKELNLQVTELISIRLD